MEPADAITLLRRDPSSTGIFSDFDGTLSPIVDVPEEARPADGVAEALRVLAASFRTVAIVSARSLEDLRQRVKVPGVLLAGAYGRERSDRAQRRATEGWETVAIAASAATRSLDGVRVERKGNGVALHFRNGRQHEQAVREIAELLSREYSLELRPGRMVCDLVAPGPGKGEAIATLIDEASLRTAFVAGDDVADVEAFALLSGKEIELVIGAVASPEAPDDLTKHADLTFDSPAELARFLAELGAELAGSSAT